MVTQANNMEKSTVSARGIQTSNDLNNIINNNQLAFTVPI